MDANQQPVAKGACEWCGKEAHQRLTVEDGRSTARGIHPPLQAFACPEHYVFFHMLDEVGDGRAQPGW